MKKLMTIRSLRSQFQGRKAAVGGFKHFFIFHHIWDVILPIDELHHFSRWLLHHQPDIIFYHH
jgi:hypothetical protein